MRTRSILALVLCVVAVLVGACGGDAAGGGGGGPEHVERGVWYPIELGPPCAGADLPRLSFDGSDWDIALVRDSTGHLLKAADLGKEATGEVRLVSDDLAEYRGTTGIGLTASFHRHDSGPIACP